MKYTVLHCYPDSGGVGLYAESQRPVYQLLKDFTVATRGWPDDASPQSVVDHVRQARPAIVHFEIGSNQASLYKASRTLLQTNPEIKQVVTVHDPQIVVLHPSGWQLPSGLSPQLLPRKIARLVLEKTINRSQLRGWLQSKKIQFITLRPRALVGATYLPQLPYYKPSVSSKPVPKAPLRVGFVGYWGESKGIGTLLDAWQLGISPFEATLTLYGDSFVPHDSYAAAIKQQAERQGVTLAGVPARTVDLTKAIRGLDIVVLPYWPENPAGVSAVAMRVAELGVPVIASRTPQLVEVLSDLATYYKPAKSERALHTQLETVIKNYAPALKQAQRLQKKLYEERSPRVVSERLEGIFHKLI